MKVVEVTTKKHQQQFLRLPFKIYEGCPYWTPPIIHEEKRSLGFSDHPFYDNACIKHWLCFAGDAENDRDLIGRIAAVNNYNYPRTGFFGFFECYPIVAAAEALFDAAKVWLNLQRKTEMMGPVNPSFNYTCGTLVSTFDEPTAIMMPYNHDYYNELIKLSGLEKAQDLLTYYVSYAPDGKIPKAEELLESKIVRAAEMSKRLLGIQTRKVTKKSLKGDIREFLRLYNESMQDTWMFSPLTDSEMDCIIDQLKWILHPDLITAVEKDGKIIGALIDLPDISPTIRKIKGKLFPFGWARMIAAPKRTRHIRVICSNVSPEYQMLGVGGILVADSLQPALNMGYTSAEFSWVLESNTLASETLKRHGAKITKYHRIYSRKITDESFSVQLPESAE